MLQEPFSGKSDFSSWERERRRNPIQEDLWNLFFFFFSTFFCSNARSTVFISQFGQGSLFLAKAKDFIYDINEKIYIEDLSFIHSL